MRPIAKVSCIAESFLRYDTDAEYQSSGEPWAGCTEIQTQAKTSSHVWVSTMNAKIV